MLKKQKVTNFREKNYSCKFQQNAVLNITIQILIIITVISLDVLWNKWHYLEVHLHVFSTFYESVFSQMRYNWNIATLS